MIKRSLARCNKFDIGIEDHGLLVLYGHFEYEDGEAQGLGYCIDSAFLYRFLGVFNVQRLQDINGRSCWVTHTHSDISLVEPLHAKDGTPFILGDWQEFSKQHPQPSPYEQRTGRKP